MILRSFEFLGACSSGNTTLSPGDGSFTTALIWALKALAEEQSKFLITELYDKIRDAPNFPKDQVPVQIDRGSHSLQRIMLAPLPETSDQADSTLRASSGRGPQGLLNLNLIFDEVPSKEYISQFAEALNRFMWQTGMPVNKIIWGGLTSWGGVQHSPGAHAKRLTAVKLFEYAGIRAKSKRTGCQATLSDVPIPLSGTERLSRYPTLDDSPQPIAKRRKG